MNEIVFSSLTPT